MKILNINPNKKLPLCALDCFLFSQVLFWVLFVFGQYIYLAVNPFENILKSSFRSEDLSTALFVSFVFIFGSISSNLLIRKIYSPLRSNFKPDSRLLRVPLTIVVMCNCVWLVSFSIVYRSSLDSFIFGNAIPNQLIFISFALLAISVNIAHKKRILDLFDLSSYLSLRIFFLRVLSLLVFASLIITARVYSFSVFFAILFFYLWRFLPTISYFCLTLRLSFKRLLLSLLFLSTALPLILKFFSFYSVFRDRSSNATDTVFIDLIYRRSIAVLAHGADALSSGACNVDTFFVSLLSGPLSFLPNQLRFYQPEYLVGFGYVHPSSLGLLVDSLVCNGIVILCLSSFVISFVSTIVFYRLVSFSLWHFPGFPFPMILWFSSISGIFLIRSAPYYWAIPFLGLVCILPAFFSLILKIKLSPSSI